MDLASRQRLTGPRGRRQRRAVRWPWRGGLLTAAALGGLVAVGHSEYVQARWLLWRAQQVVWMQSSYQPTPGDSAYWALKHLEGLVRRILLLHINGGGLAPNLAGQLTDRTILIDPRYPPNARLEILAHEAAHRLEPPGLPDPDREVFAEVVSFLVCRRVGLKTGYQAHRFLAQYKTGFRVVTDYWPEIQWATDFLAPR